MEKPEEIFHIIEHFCLGRRRLHLFGTDNTIRPGEGGKGVGKDMEGVGVGVGAGVINKCGIFLLKSLIVTVSVMYHVFHASKVSESFQTELSFFLALGLGL